jgi:crotonobetainyl-CoA:carnitine CoA-transferase CaiB-like acyl-CoA transferase
MPGALEDVRVVDLTHALNGPFCTMLLGHLGAEVIKVEPPSGDNFRRSWMPPGSPQDGYEFMMVNTNKKSIAVDLKTEDGRNVVRRLIAVSDVMVENYQKGTIEKFGLDYESVKQINPRLIYACSRGYGETGPYAPYGSNAGVNNGMAGWTHAAWELNGAPGTKALGIGDEAGGVSMVIGILGALHARERTGRGQKIEVAMQEAVLGFLVGTYHELFTGNKVGGPPTQVGDGYFTLRLPEITDNAWKELAVVIGREDLQNDPKFATREGRRANKKALEEMLFAWARDKTRDELWVKLRDLGYFGAPVLSLTEVFEDPHVKARETFVEREHPTGGTIKLLSPWIHMSDTPSSIRAVSPTLGQHTDEILSGVLACTPAEISSLRASGAVR